MYRTASIHVRRGHVVHRGWSALTVVVLALSALLGGQRYFYCRSMQRVMEPTACCAGSTAGLSDRPTIAQTHGCFELRELARLASFTVGSDFAIAPAGLAAVLPIAAACAPAPSARRLGREYAIRAGPASGEASRARSMVFLI